MIVKVMQPVSSGSPYLIYDQTRKFTITMQYPPYEVCKSCMFVPSFWTTFIENGELKFLRQVEHQKW